MQNEKLDINTLNTLMDDCEEKITNLVAHHYDSLDNYLDDLVFVLNKVQSIEYLPTTQEELVSIFQEDEVTGWRFFSFSASIAALGNFFHNLTAQSIRTMPSPTVHPEYKKHLH